jgi:hypothetical protein
MRTGSYVDALDESFEYMVSSPTPQYILDYYATEAEENRATKLAAEEHATPPTIDTSDTLINRLAAHARNFFTLFQRPQ